MNIFVEFADVVVVHVVDGEHVVVGVRFGGSVVDPACEAFFRLWFVGVLEVLVRD